MSSLKPQQYIKPVKFWVHMVTPLIYDDSLTLYELMGKVTQKLNEVIDIVNPLGEGIEETIKQYLEEFKTEWEQELKDFEAEVNETISTNNTTLNNRIDKLTSDLTAQQNSFEDTINQDIAEFEERILTQIATITVSIQDTDRANRIWTLAQISKALGDISGTYPPLIDPTDGKTEDIQTILNHMWDAWRENALSATEYDNLELTATAYDNKELTANAYDNYGKTLLVPDTNTVSVNGVPFKLDAVNLEVMKNG